MTNLVFCIKSQLVTFYSCNSQSQTDSILVHKLDFRCARNLKVIPNQECALKHKLLVFDLELTLQIPLAKPFNHIRFVWKLHDPDVQFAFCGRIERSFTS